MKKPELTPIQLEIRAKLMIHAEDYGLNQPAIAQIFKVTRARVYQIINNFRAKQLRK